MSFFRHNGCFYLEQKTNKFIFKIVHVYFVIELVPKNIGLRSRNEKNPFPHLRLPLSLGKKIQKTLAPWDDQDLDFNRGLRRFGTWDRPRLKRHNSDEPCSKVGYLLSGLEHRNRRIHVTIKVRVCDVCPKWWVHRHRTVEEGFENLSGHTGPSSCTFQGSGVMSGIPRLSTVEVQSLWKTFPRLHFHGPEVGREGRWSTTVGTQTQSGVRTTP